MLSYSIFGEERRQKSHRSLSIPEMQSAFRKRYAPKSYTSPFLSFQVIFAEEQEAAQNVDEIVDIFLIARIPEEAHSREDLSSEM